MDEDGSQVYTHELNELILSSHGRFFPFPRDHRANLIQRLHSPPVHYHTGGVSRGLVYEGINPYELALALLRSTSIG